MTGGNLADYLRARRAQLQPEDVGLAAGTRRRVAGLRREEVAMLAGISPEYYLRLEQGRELRPSDQVLAALAQALHLDADGTHYLQIIGRPARRAVRESTLVRVKSRVPGAVRFVTMVSEYDSTMAKTTPSARRSLDRRCALALASLGHAAQVSGTAGRDRHAPPQPKAIPSAGKGRSALPSRWRIGS